MRTLVGAIVGLLTGIGVWLAVAGWTGVASSDKTSRQFDWRKYAGRSTLAAAVAIVVGLLSRWPAAGFLAGGATVIAPMLIGLKQQRDLANAKSEALASWAEMLRDTIGSHAGLREAIGLTAKVAPPPIRREVQLLAIRAEHDSLANALRQFAVEVADPVADLIVAALVISAERQARGLVDLLSQIARSARDQSMMRLRIETGRAKTFTESRNMAVITVGMAIILMLSSRAFMRPYDTFTGQLVMMFIGGLFGGALWSLVVLGRPSNPPRLLMGVTEPETISQ